MRYPLLNIIEIKNLKDFFVIITFKIKAVFVKYVV